jgi:transposase
MRPYAIRDDQWDRIKDLLPGREGYVGGTAADNRLFVEAVIFRFRAGIPWRDLPERFGKWSNVYQRFNRWAKSGVWSRVFKHLASDSDNEYVMLDSAIVRAHQHSAGARKRGRGQRRPSHRAIAGRPDNQDQRPHRRLGQSDRFDACARPGARSQGSAGIARRRRGRCLHRRQGL